MIYNILTFSPEALKRPRTPFHTHSRPPTALPSPHEPLPSAAQPAEARPSPVARLALPLLTLERPEGLLRSTCAKGTRQ